MQRKWDSLSWLSVRLTLSKRALLKNFCACDCCISERKSCSDSRFSYIQFAKHSTNTVWKEPWQQSDSPVVKIRKWLVILITNLILPSHWMLLPVFHTGHMIRSSEMDIVSLSAAKFPSVLVQSRHPAPFS